MSSKTSFIATFKEFPDSIRFVMILAVGFMLFIVWDQWHWWSTREDYSFGFLVPLFVAYVLFDRWEKIVYLITGRPPADGRETFPPLSPGGLSTGLERLLRFSAHAVVVGGAALFLLGAAIRAAGGPQNPASLAISVGFGVLLLPLVFLHAPGGVVGAQPPRNAWRAFWQDRRVQLASLFLFVAFIWGISAPLVSVLETKLSVFLLNRVTDVVVFVFDMGGFPLEQRGNVLMLPNGGEVGVAEACSGIRSLTACLFAGSFLGAVFLNRYWKKVALIVAALCLAVFTNLLRSLFLTSWAYNFGAEAIGGTVHDVAGYAVLVLTCVGLICLLPVFNFSMKLDPEELDWEEESPDAKSDGEQVLEKALEESETGR